MTKYDVSMTGSRSNSILFLGFLPLMPLVVFHYSVLPVTVVEQTCRQSVGSRASARESSTVERIRIVASCEDFVVLSLEIEDQRV